MYLDNAATTQLKPKIKDYIISLLDTYQNPSSMYQSGVNAKQIINTARNNVAKFINANPEKYYFLHLAVQPTIRFLSKVVLRKINTECCTLLLLTNRC